MTFQDKAREILKSKGFINDFAVEELTLAFKEEVEQIINAEIDNWANGAGEKEIFIRKMQIDQLRAAQRARLNKTIEEK